MLEIFVLPSVDENNIKSDNLKQHCPMNDPQLGQPFVIHFNEHTNRIINMF